MLRVQLDEDNDLPVGGPKLVSGLESTATALRAVFSVQAGDWSFDFTFGTQWRRAILRKFFDANTTREIIAATANTVPDIVPIASSQIDVDTTTLADSRQAQITIRNILDREGALLDNLALTTTL